MCCIKLVLPRIVFILELLICVYFTFVGLEQHQHQQNNNNKKTILRQTPHLHNFDNFSMCEAKKRRQHVSKFKCIKCVLYLRCSGIYEGNVTTKHRIFCVWALASLGEHTVR